MEQTQTDMLTEKQKVALAIERMQSLAKAVVDEFEIQFKPDKKWEFSQKDKIMKFIQDDLAKMTDREVAATILHNLGHALYTTMPTLKKCPEPKRQFFQLMNAVEDIRAEEQMMQGLPGTFDSFRYKFKKQDAGISAKIEEKLEPHTQYLYSLQKMFWGQDVSKIDPKVLSALQESEEVLFDAYNAETTQEMVDIIADRLWYIYEDLIPPPDKDKKYEDEEKQTLSDIANQAISIESIMDAMKDLSEGKTPGGE